jgi:hypothetical protein
MARWNSCNILQVLPDANRLWQFDTKGHLSRETRAAIDQPLPANLIAKSWKTLWQPRLNVAWLPPESVFLRVIELPRSSYDETVSMVELQLEKLSPTPLAQAVWTMYILPQATGDLQTVVVVIAARRAVEEFLGKLEEKNFQADRIEAPMLDQLEAITSAEDSAWVFPSTAGHARSALVAWSYGGILRSVSFILLPTEGDRVANLKGQLAQLVWAGELEGWLTAKPKWHLVAEGAAATEWEALLRQALDEPIATTQPLSITELAARTARRTLQAQTNQPNTPAVLLPPEYSNRYREQFRDRLWLHGLYMAGILYVIFVAFYFSAAALAEHKEGTVEQQVAAISDDYTNVMQLQAKCALLQDRQNLKYAALDCWKLVANYLPEGITLQRFTFGSGQTLSLTGTAGQSQIESLFTFNNALEKATLGGKPAFKEDEPLSYQQYNDQVNWRFSLNLLQGEKAE